MRLYLCHTLKVGVNKYIQQKYVLSVTNGNILIKFHLHLQIKTTLTCIHKERKPINLYNKHVGLKFRAGIQCALTIILGFASLVRIQIQKYIQYRSNDYVVTGAVGIL